MRQQLDRTQIWSAVKAAIRAYEKDPNMVNASRVEVAVKGIRDMNEESIWRQWKGVRPSLMPTRKDKGMSTAAALVIPRYQGLTNFETRVATALMHARFRGAFSYIYPRKIDEGGTVLEIWGRTPSEEPAFRLQRQGDSVVAVSERKGLVASSDSIEELVAKISSELPPPFPF